MAPVTRSMLFAVALLLGSTHLLPAFEPVVVPNARRLVVDSLVDFDVEIRGRDADAIRLEVVSSRRRAEEIVYEEQDGTLRIQQQRRRSLWRFLPRRLLITVPPEVFVEVRTLTGDIRLDGVVGTTVLSTSAGNIEASRSRGLMNISTASGSVDLSGGFGRTFIRSSSGDVRVSNRSGRFVVETASGDIRLRGTRVEENSSFVSSAGSIELRLSNPRSEVRGNFDSGTGELHIDGVNLDGPITDPQGLILILARTASGSLRIFTGR